jgi:glycosyltransferase involved in cell wall biosynthesis
MHIAFVLPRFYPYRGGYENSLLALSKYLVGRGHRVTVFTTTADDLEALWLRGFRTFPEGPVTVEGVRVLRFPLCYNRTRRRASRLMGMLPYWRWQAQFWRPAFRVPGLHQALRAIDADLFHVGPLPYTNLMYAGLQAGEARGVAVVATPCTHLGEEGSEEIAQHYLQPYQIALLRRCVKVFCMTQIELQRLEQVGVTAKKAVVGHGIDLELVVGGNPEYLRDRYNVDGPVVLHLGMKAFDKGSNTLVEAMRMVWQRGSRAWLVMAGPSLSAFDDFIAERMKDCPRLLNLPPFPDHEKRDLLASATLVAQPSRVESLGLVLLEAWANTKPVIAADIAVSRQLVIQSGGGVVVPFADVKALAQEIEKLLADENLRRTMGVRGQKKALEYDGKILWRRIAEEIQLAADGYELQHRRP